MKVIFTDQSRLDLIAIGDYIAEDNPVRALSFVLELEVHCMATGDFPRSGALILRHEKSGIRRVVHGNYGIFYKVADAVYIVRVLNASMDYQRILFPEE